MALIEYNPPTSPYLDIVYRDESILVFNKPSGLLSVRGKAKEHQDSLQARVESVWPDVGIAHRLDMSTSGLMVMALTKSALKELNRQFQQRETEKRYEALAWGSVSKEEGIINEPLIVDWPNKPKQKVCYEWGKPSETLWRVMERENKFTRVELTPITGRSHQLRVHLASIGHPILGDKFYAHEDAFNLRSRLCLHAKKLGFKHPITKEKVTFYSEVPF